MPSPKKQPISGIARCLAALLVLFSQLAQAGTITGQIQTATGGVIANGTLTFILSQPAGSSTLFGDAVQGTRVVAALL